MAPMAHVALFDPCYMQAIRPGDAANARRVLELLGDTVTLIDGRCCGQPAFNSGFRPEARAAGRQLLKVARQFEAVVVASGSCTAMVRHYLPALFDGRRRQGAASIAGRFVDFSTYVAAHPALPYLGFKLSGAVAYHDSCHSRRELQASAATLELLGRIEGLEVRRLPHEEECCGFGGTFAVKNADVSTAMLDEKLAAVVASGAAAVCACDSSCLMHIGGGLHRRGIDVQPLHLAEILAW